MRLNEAVKLAQLIKDQQAIEMESKLYGAGNLTHCSTKQTCKKSTKILNLGIPSNLQRIEIVADGLAGLSSDSRSLRY